MVSRSLELIINTKVQGWSLSKDTAKWTFSNVNNFNKELWVSVEPERKTKVNIVFTRIESYPEGFGNRQVVLF